ncbi:MAG: hypothetical protein N2439_11115, partial [Anaerolineae bacterium]|nr:hypothetical protein [Anaerolineae bacterium]
FRPDGSSDAQVDDPSGLHHGSISLEDFAGYEGSDDPAGADAIPVRGDSDYSADDSFDAFRELAALDVPPAPEFSEWVGNEPQPAAHARTQDLSFPEGAIETGAPVVEAAEPKQDEVALTDDFDIPDFDFQSLNDTPVPAGVYEEFEDAFIVASSPEPMPLKTGKTGFDDPDFNFDTLIDEEMAATMAAAGAGAAAVSMRGNPSINADADNAFDPFQRSAIGDDVFAPVASEPERRKPWLVPAAIMGALVLLGGGAYYAFSGGAPDNGGGPVLVKADTEPVKIAPENPGGAMVANQDKAVYDKVAGGEMQLPTQGALVSESEEPVDIAAVTPPAEPAAPTDAAESIEAAAPAEASAKSEDRVEAPAATEAQAPAAETAAVTPKKVRTVIVKPDGTLGERPVVAPGVEAAEPASEPVVTEPGPVASIVPAPEPAPQEAAAPVPAAKPEATAEADPAPAAQDPIAQIAACLLYTS